MTGIYWRGMIDVLKLIACVLASLFKSRPRPELGCSAACPMSISEQNDASYSDFAPLQGEPLSLTTLREKLIEIGAKVISGGRYVTFQVAEVAVPRHRCSQIF
jgi:hypothetical protein